MLKAHFTSIIICLVLVVGFFAGMYMATTTDCVMATVQGITKDNYLEYEKPIKDSYGYNKGECETPYLDGEEQFYNEQYDHWNVEKVYDESLVVNQDETKVCPCCGRPL